MIQVKNENIINNASVLELEITTLRKLIDRRHDWLAVPVNKMRGTYDAVLHDTHNLEYQLIDLEKALKELLTSKYEGNGNNNQH